jgi:hypothetical protein
MILCIMGYVVVEEVWIGAHLVWDFYRIQLRIICFNQ